MNIDYDRIILGYVQRSLAKIFTDASFFILTLTFVCAGGTYTNPADITAMISVAAAAAVVASTASAVQPLKETSRFNMDSSGGTATPHF